MTEGVPVAHAVQSWVSLDSWPPPMMMAPMQNPIQRNYQIVPGQRVASQCA